MVQTSTRRVLAVTAAVLLAVAMAPRGSDAETNILTPGASGDQLIFLYDATGNRVPFIAVSNFAPAPVVVETAFYGGQPLALITTEVATIPAGGNLPLIDPTDAARFPGVKGTAGLVVVTPVVSPTDLRPIVPGAPSRDTTAGPLFGGFTLANLDLGAAFGQNPFARLAVDVGGKRAAEGAIVDGTAVQFQRFHPDVLTVPFYFNPTTLSDPAKDGNRILLAAFTDTYSSLGFRIAPTNPDFSFDYLMEDSAGTVLVNTFSDLGVSDPIAVNGVLFTNLQTLAGPVPLTTSGNAVFITSTAPIPDNVNLFGVISQALGTFAVGQVLPGGNSVPVPEPLGKPGRVPCTPPLTVRDVWAFSVRNGDQVKLTADVSNPAAGGDLKFALSCAENDSGVQFFATTSDNDGPCSNNIPGLGNSCPRAAFTWNNANGTCVVAVAAAQTDAANCPAGGIAYTLFPGNSSPGLVQVADDQS